MRNCFSTPKALTPAEDPNFPDLSKVPSYYHQLQEVFNKGRALALPPHCPYDYAIELLPGASLHKRRLYCPDQKPWP